ncbi:hypothetical protein [Flavobacterium salmonis]|uniref:MORN repeat variant n=1 Tax=Flavobacterium salmonis TaxID=2654844 RepID=A0A6V6YPK1_9FLAO|nr:hypothetical protein [Flavobacterium salmonis]CAD0001431.1 hypothetical protein FLAT13_00557 [Flavobacterium salmonis]
MRTITLLMALVLFANCKAQVENKTVTTTLNKNKMERPIITPEFEKLNLEDYKDGLIIEESIGNTAPYVGFKYNSYSYRKINDIGTTSLHGSTIGRFGYSFTAKDSYYTIAKGYYKNGYIHSKCIISSRPNQSIFMGRQYFFNQEGKLEKTVDHDQVWGFSYEKVIEYILERKSPLYSKDEYWGAEITQEGKEKKYWQLILDTQKTTNKSTWEIIKLDAMTGEILYQIEFEGDRIWHADTYNHNPIERIIVADKTLKN